MTEHILTVTPPPESKASPSCFTTAECSCGEWRRFYSKHQLALAVIDIAAAEHAAHVKRAA